MFLSTTRVQRTHPKRIEKGCFGSATVFGVFPPRLSSHKRFLNRVLPRNSRPGTGNFYKITKRRGVRFCFSKGPVGTRPCRLRRGVFSHGGNVLRASGVSRGQTIVLKYKSIKDLMTVRLTQSNINRFLLTSPSMVRCRGVYQRRYNVRSIKSLGVGTLGHGLLGVGPRVSIRVFRKVIRGVPGTILSSFYMGKRAIFINYTSGHKTSICTGHVDVCCKTTFLSIKF